MPAKTLQKLQQELELGKTLGVSESDLADYRDKYVYQLYLREDRNESYNDFLGRHPEHRRFIKEGKVD